MVVVFALICRHPDAAMSLRGGCIRAFCMVYFIDHIFCIYVMFVSQLETPTLSRVRLSQPNQLSSAKTSGQTDDIPHFQKHRRRLFCGATTNIIMPPSCTWICIYMHGSGVLYIKTLACWLARSLVTRYSTILRSYAHNFGSIYYVFGGDSRKVRGRHPKTLCANECIWRGARV